MALHLVSEARPIPWKQLSDPEQGQLKEADGWIKAIVEDSTRKKTAVDKIDKNRSGRVLFISGRRGVGKTSLLLTLLDRWRGKEKDPDSGPKIPNLHVLLPVLDFDPLPRGMPLHGWLLEPWWQIAKDLEAKGPRGATPNDLSEMWANLFERVVIGWTRATVEGKGVVEKAIAYHEQSSGWIDTPSEWHEFVNTAVCRSVRCFETHCKEAHSHTFVVAIDDVDLQVEQVPQLLHAIRLLHHPNVVYVLTGNYDHMKLVLDLDYIGRHEQLTSTHRYRERRLGDELWEKIKESSLLLSDALLEKALPSHARLTLETLSAKTVLAMTVSDELVTKESERQTVGKVLAPNWSAVIEKVGDLPIATARRAQHAIDRHMGHSRRSSLTLTEEQRLQFVADLCGTTIQSEDGEPPFRFMLRGRITTQLGATFRAWDGDRLKVMLTESPSFAFLPNFNEADPRVSEEAHRAVVVQLAVEKKLADALGLVWSPDAGVAATEVRWKSDLTNIDGRAVFRWPWLARPTASDVLDLEDVAQKMSSKVPGNSQRDLNDEMIIVWLSKNIEWRYAWEDMTDHNNGGPCTSFKEIADRLEDLCERGDEVRTDTTRWVGELLVMTAPYFGLPENVASVMRNQLGRRGIMPSRTALRTEQKRMVTNAIILGQSGFGRSRRESLEGGQQPSSPDFDAAVKEFLEHRRAMSLRDSKWWSWLKGGERSSRTARKMMSSRTAPAEPKKRAPAKNAASGS